SGNNFLQGEAGDDILVGGGGVDNLIGGLGADTFVIGAGDTAPDGIADLDVLDVIDLTAVVTTDGVTLEIADDGNGNAEVRDLNIPANVYVNILGLSASQLSLDPSGLVTRNATLLPGATAGNDTLTGTVGDDLIKPLGTALGSGDLINASAGNDTLFLEEGGGTYTVNYAGQTGAITAIIGDTFGTIEHDSDGNGIADNTLTVVNIDDGVTDSGALILRGTNGADFVTTARPADGVTFEFRGLGGNDTFVGGDGGDRISYASDGAGVVVNLGDAAETLSGQNVAGHSALDGSGATDILLGSIEQVRGSNFADVLVGGTTNDTFITEKGDDTVDGGGGFDTIRYDRTGIDTVTVDLSAVTPAATVTFSDLSTNTDTLISIESVRGSVGADTITGDALDNRLDGRHGDDVITGGGGNDTFIGGSGNDTLTGGAGDDLFIYNDESRIGGVAQAGALAGNDLIVAGGGNDTLQIDPALDILTVELIGDDLVFSVEDAAFNAFTITVQNHLTTDALEHLRIDDNDDGILDTFRLATAATGLDVSGQAAGDRWAIAGGATNEILRGNILGDVLIGNGGADSIDGSAGDDELFGGAGADTLTGGAGADTYFYADATDSTIGAANRDRITDFEAGGDGIGVIDQIDIADLFTLPFSYLGTGTAASFTGGADNAEAVLDTTTEAGLSILKVDIDGNATADMEIDITGFIGTLDVTDFFVDQIGGGGINTIAGTDGQNDTLIGTVADETFTASTAAAVTPTGDNTVSTGGGTDTLEIGFDFDLLTAEIVDAGLGTAGPNDLRFFYEDANGDVYTTTVIDHANGAPISFLRFDRDGDGTTLETMAVAATLDASGGTQDTAVAGSAGVDTITGSAFNDILIGNDGADTIIGGAGFDEIIGGADGDTITGGAGGDEFFYDAISDAAVSAGETITDFEETNFQEHIVLSVDLVAGNSITFVGDQNTAFLGGGVASARFNDATDLLEIDVDGNQTTDMEITLTGVSLANLVNDPGFIEVDADPAQFFLGDGTDQTFFGGTGDDTLIGAGGADTLTGGVGADLFVYQATTDSNAVNTDVITDFEAAATGDKIVLEGVIGDSRTFTFNGAGPFTAGVTTAASARFTDATNLLEIDVDGDQTADMAITLSGIVAANLSTANFVVITTGTDGANDTLSGTTGNDFFLASTTDSATAPFGDQLTLTGGQDTLIFRDPLDLLNASFDGTDLVFEYEDLTDTNPATNQHITTVVNHATTPLTFVQFEFDDFNPGAETFQIATSIGVADVDTMIVGTDAADSLTGNTGDDILIGNGGNDTLIGGDGDDTFVGGTGADNYQGGNGIDTISFHDATGSVVIDLSSGGTIANDGFGGTGDTFSLIEGIEGGSFADTITGDGFDNFLSGEEGNDVISGGAGNDEIEGGDGLDNLTGDLGNDVFIYTSSSDSGVGGLLRDVITDFDAGTFGTSVDQIDLSSFVTGTFSFLGNETQAFDGSDGAQARFNNATKILEIDSDGDTQTDMEIELTSTDGAALDDSDFITSTP
ncbi:MAG: hypothetical protein COW30_15545, partial [Rhodospirillales bacterium CG15_BIG_FIL_POST_REV_8_21_14_020_66_15]